jgi:signal transduction histidine kinase
MSVIVRDAGGRELFRSPVQYQPVYAATVPLWRRFDGPSVEVSLRPEAAGRLLIGGLPRARLPVLLALLTLVGALVVIALLLARRAQELAQLRADFTSSVSHELRTPLSQILLFAETLHFRRAISERDRENALVVIMREARRLAHLVDNVLLFSRTERRAARISAHPRPLAPLVRDVVGSFEPLARVRQVTLRTSLDERVVAPVDPGALRQVLLNLLDNAVKYGPDGQTVDVGLAIQDSVARIWVADQGKGISPAEYERIWEPFVRLDSGEYSVTTGSGIGLSVVRQLVALHGGRCWAEAASTRPEGGRPAGARFVIELPKASLGLIDAAESVGERRDPAGQAAT